MEKENAVYLYNGIVFGGKNGMEYWNIVQYGKNLKYTVLNQKSRHRKPYNVCFLLGEISE